MVLSHRKQDDDDDDDDDYKPKEKEFKAFYILIFPKRTCSETVTWLLDLITRSHHDGGAELLVHVTHTKNEGVIFEIGATALRLLQGAEALEIIKEDKRKNMREFVFCELDEFLKPGLDIHNLLSTSEKQRIIFEEIMAIRAMEKKEIVGYKNIQLFPGQSIVQVCLNNGIIESMFPLHEPIELKSLKAKWLVSWSNKSLASTFLPLDDVRNYFGEAVAFYFAFISFYTWALVPPAVIGILQTVISVDISKSYVLFASFKMIWLTLFLECWKRKSNELAYTWGTLKLVNIPKFHPTFRGKYMEIDPVTKRYIPVYPAVKRHLKVYCVTLPVVILCLLFAIIIMLIYFKVEKYAIEHFDDGSWFGWVITQVPGIAYAIIVYAMNVGYRYIAYILTEWENHKVQESFDNHRIVKLLLFEFVNNFVCMWYIAFFEQDLSLLKWQICIMMIVNQVFNQLQEALLPYLAHKYFKTDTMESSPRIKNILDQCKMWPYEGTYDDYLELFIQFGYVFLFSAVFPLAGIFAIINNVVEVWVDGFKLCSSYQRPQAQPVKGIGIWQLAFEVLSLISVMSNCALIFMSPLVQAYAPDMTMCCWLLVAVIVEHVIIAVKMVVSYLISDVPKWVKIAIQKHQYETLQALKQERQNKNKIMIQSLSLDEKFD